MSAPSTEALVPLAVLAASLAGSAHCAAMCGGLALAVGPTPRAAAAYHLGRLAAYSALGAAAGALGSTLLGFAAAPVLSLLAAAALAAALVSMGVQLWRGSGPHFFQLPSRWLARLFPAASRSPLAAGLMTALLPCGWLHAFVLGAAATRSAAAGAAYLAVFWAGTLPFLAGGALALRRLLSPAARRAPRVAAVLLVAAGFLSLGLRVSGTLARLAHPAAARGATALAEPEPGCPLHRPSTAR